MAVNMALGVHYAAGVNIPVHRNLVLLKPKATPMASFASNNPIPASKFGGLQLPTATATPTEGKITVAATTGSGATTGQTTIQFVNSTGSQLTLKGQKFWLGNPDKKDIPDPVDDSAEFVHTGDANGNSVGGLLYLLDGLVFWVLAWRNTSGSSNNKVYTNIISSDDTSVLSDPDKFWAGVYSNLLKSSARCNVDDASLGYSAHLNITSGNTPTASASFSAYVG